MATRFPNAAMGNSLQQLKQNNLPVIFEEVAPMNAGTLMNLKPFLDSIYNCSLSVCDWSIEIRLQRPRCTLLNGSVLSFISTDMALLTSRPSKSHFSFMGIKIPINPYKIFVEE